MSFLKIRDLSYTYPNTGIRAVDGLNFDAQKGEIIAVIGPNASGKSTFAMLLKRLLTPETGRVWVDGQERSGKGPDAGIGLLFPAPENQLITSIVEEDVAFGLEVKGEPSHIIRTKTENILEQLGIAHLKRRMPHLLSGGEQQMTAMAGVLVLDPDILVLDEPTTFLDPDAKTAVLAALKQLASQGKLVIIITHDMKEAAAADRVWMLLNGRVAADGVPEEVFTNPGVCQKAGVSPPFLLSLALGLRASGIDVKWPAKPAALARALAGALKGRRPPLQDLRLDPSGPSSASPDLVFDKIHFGYGDGDLQGGTVLAGVDYSVPEGIMALVCGANGSGKSTLMQMSNGLVKPDRGRVLLGGRGLECWKKEPGGLPARVGVVFQNPERQVFSETVYEDIAFGPRNMGLDGEKIDARVLRAADWVGLSRTILKRSVLTLSGGQMRRAAIAGILAMETRLLILDEPTDGLDPSTTREFYTNARQYCDETGTTMVVAAHAVPEHTGWIEYMGHLAGGKMQSAGTPSEILTGPGRTLPKHYLPDHLILEIELADAGLHTPGSMTGPQTVLKTLLDHVSKAPP
ncbi:MAG: energy-coupling factor transporter ATPase [Pseudomonadota bacterium]|jgi:energy-coupling factor transport system ATP-binding protein